MTDRAPDPPPELPPREPELDVRDPLPPDEDERPAHEDERPADDEVVLPDEDVPRADVELPPEEPPPPENRPAELATGRSGKTSTTGFAGSRSGCLRYGTASAMSLFWPPTFWAPNIPASKPRRWRSFRAIRGRETCAS